MKWTSLVFLLMSQFSLLVGDCERIFWEYSYLRFERIFLCEIEEEVGDHYYKVKIIEQFKGISTDTLFTGSFASFKPNLKDTFLIYGGKWRNENTTATGACNANVTIGKRQMLSSIRLKSLRERVNMEMKILRSFRDQTSNDWRPSNWTKFGSFKSCEKNTLNNVISFAESVSYNTIFRPDLEENQIYYHESNLVRVKVRFLNTKLESIEFIDDCPEEIKESIKFIIKEKTELNFSEKGFGQVSKLELIESFIYPKK